MAQQPNLRPAAWSGSATPPAAIHGLDDARPFLPLELSRAWLEKVESVRLRREQLAAEGQLDGLNPQELVAAGAALTGVLRIPVIPVRYADVTPPFAEPVLEQRLFGPGGEDTMSLSRYWDEVSGGLLKVEGHVAPWVTLRKPARHYLPPATYGWSRFGRIVELREEALAAADAHLDFGQYDNDGPDNMPNSGDDDGFVDFVAFVYALPCPTESRAGAIWPHRAAMPPYETRSLAANGGRIRIADYVVLPAVDGHTCGPLNIGVLAHETGHALGFPDLYDYDGTSLGIGSWGLMGTGSHAALHSPAHLGAWEKEQLGWVKVRWITDADSTLELEPVARSRTVYRYEQNEGQYLLLENRQRIGSDRFIAGSGLLVWQVDPERGELGAWNSDESRSAVGIVEADGRGDLGRGRRADSGDPFPGRSRRDTFRSALSGGLHLTEIRVRDELISARIQATPTQPVLLPAPGVLRMSALAGGDPVRQNVQLLRQGDSTVVAWHAVTRAGWLDVQRAGDTLAITAQPAGLPAGSYTDTIDIAGDEGDVLAQVVVSFYLAAPGVGQIIATELPWSWGVAVHGGRILQASYGWDPLGLRPRPRVLQLREGAAHAETLTRLAADALYAPIVDPADGAIFVLARARDGNYLYQILGTGEAHIVATRIGTEPAYGAAVLPDGSIAVADWSGAISRVWRDGRVHAWMNLGTNVYQIAADGEGNIYAATYAGDLLRVSHGGDRRTIATNFGAGRLVAVTVTPAGDVLAAERGGMGRIMRVNRNGGTEIVYRSHGARFYGLAVDDGFLFALDLTNRQLLRIPLP